MTSTTFQGPVQTGQDTGAPATTTIGTMVIEQRATVSNVTSGASTIVLPDCTITDVILDVLVSASGNAGGMLVRVGTTADATRYANVNIAGYTEPRRCPRTPESALPNRLP